ncbi:MAG: OmpA family protein, partial [Desulfobulbaceae bacterium]|nr:OmpA family protein [Desulfobulbaceae bacterium]
YNELMRKATDSDGDGLADRLDLCPDSPGNAAVNEFGCRPDKPIILAGVVFESGTAELSQSAEASLNKTVRILQHYPGKRFEIGGHTDSIGDPGWNLTVSLKRAESVKEYLLSKGIEKGRLEANGYGADYPVADNETSAGRAANRRVELKIIDE